MAKLTDVARAAGVSVGTVSNVFNRPEKVRTDLRARVEAAASALGYRGPDPAGRVLRAGRTDALGVILADGLSYAFNDPFARRFLSGIAEVCETSGIGLSLVAANDPDAAWRVETALVDGFVVHCLHDNPALLSNVARRGLPHVAVDMLGDGETATILTDDRSGAEAAAAHLAALDHRRVAILSLEFDENGQTGPVPPGHGRRAALRYMTTRERLAGYHAGLGWEAEAYETLNDPETAADAVEHLFSRSADRHPTALLCMSDALATAAIDALNQRGLVVPRDVSVIGFDDAPEAALATPPLTTIAQPIVEKGRLAAQIALGQAPMRSHRLPVHLVERSSTAMPPNPA